MTLETNFCDKKVGLIQLMFFFFIQDTDFLHWGETRHSISGLEFNFSGFIFLAMDE